MQEMKKLEIYREDINIVSLIDVPGQVAAILFELHKPPYSAGELEQANRELMEIAESHKK